LRSCHRAHIHYKISIMATRKKRKKTSYNAKELKEFEKLINDKLGKAKENLAHYIAQIEGLADNPDSKLKGLDNANSTVEVERLYTMAARQRKLVQHLENALLRVKNKAYGICRETGELISADRLRAVPHATLSIQAKQNQIRR